MGRMRQMNLNRGGRVRKYAEGGAVAPLTPGVDTGIAQGGQARGAIDSYFAGPQWSSNYNNDIYGGGSYGQGPIGGGVQGNQNVQQKWVPPEQTTTNPYVPPSTTTNTSGGSGLGSGPGGQVFQDGGNNNYNSDVQTGGSSGFGFGSTGGIDVNATGNDGAWLNIPSFGQEGKREDISNEEHGFTTDTVNQAYQDLSVSNPELIPQQFTAGGDQATQHETLAANQANYSNILQNQEALGLSNAEVAALNPAYNAEAQAAHADNQVGVGTWGPGGIIGTTKSADNILTSDFDNVQGAGYAPLSAAAGSGTSNNNQWSAQNQHQAKQYGLTGASAAAAGIRNIGGASAQGGDNHGLPSEYMVVGSSDGSSEVWGPDGKTYGSVEEAQAAAGVPEAKPVWEGPGIEATSIGAATAERGQIEGKAAAATKQANEYVNEQAEFNATASAEEQAANQQNQLLGDFLWKYEGADTPQMKANYAKQAEAAGLDFGGKSASDFVTEAPTGKDKAKLISDARAAKTAADQGIFANMGGPISRNMGGITPEELERRKQGASKIAQSQVQATPLQSSKAPLQPGQVKQGGGAMAGIGGKLLKTGLGAALGPLGGLLGGLFNEGGEIPMQGLNAGGWLSGLFGRGEEPELNALGRPINKAARTQTTAQQRPSKQRPQKQTPTGTQDHTRGWADTWAALTGRNEGGPINMVGPLNPQGYNAGGQAMETPIKKAMDEDKMAMAREAFEMAEGRKDEKFALDEARAAEKHAQDMKMKKAAAMTTKAPLSAK